MTDNLQKQANIMIEAAEAFVARGLSKASAGTAVHGWWRSHRNKLQKIGCSRSEANDLMVDLQNELMK